MTTTYSQTDNAATSVTITLASLASDSSLLAGRGSAAFNLAASNYVDALLTGQITLGTSPSAATIEVWVAGSLDSSPTWPDTISGSDANISLTSLNTKNSGLVLAKIINTDATSNRAYAIAPLSLRDLFGGALPHEAVIWVVQNTGAALNSTGADHFIKITPVNYTSA